ncbi:enoyl-CoA hydratase 2, peroxisomal isoform X1 [Nymphaea colorata]|nr:enoyl-CoA hydratase 2, peroxisomal isoform X1 [Nymphaea colorata]
MAGPKTIDPELVISHQFPEGDFTYSERDVVLYALGVGACSGNAVDEKELKYVYHNLGQPFVKVLPTFAVLFPFQLVNQLMRLPGLQFNPALLLHGQQYLEICKPLPTSCNVRNEAVVAGLHDKGKAAVIEIETTSYDRESGEALCKNRSTLYLRGAGGFSKSSSMYTYSRNAAKMNFSTGFPDTPPFAIHEESTQSSQALLYRLSGDYNPLHSDPVVANIAGFSRPILHGLCTLGFAVRAVIKCCCHGEPNMVKSLMGRFLLHVYPGETLITEMWLEQERVVYRTMVKERSQAVFSGFVVLNRLPSAM